MLRRPLRYLAPCALVLAFSSVASAQDEASSSLGAAPDAPTPRSRGPRMRYGVSLGVMGGGGDSSQATDEYGAHDTVSPAFGGELQGRIGVQLEDHFALFYQASLAVGHEVAVCFHVLGPSRPCPPTDDFLVLHGSSIVAETTILRGMQIGLGGTAVVAYFGSEHPAFDLRVGYLFRIGYTFGGDGPGDRRGLSIGAQASMSFVPEGGPGPLVDIAISLGWEAF